MRRSVALVSAAITTFSIVVLGSVVYAYRGLAAGPAAAGSGSLPAIQSVQVSNADVAQPAVASDQLAAPQPAAAQAPTLSVQAAASIAAQYLHRTDLYSAEMSSYNGAAAFKITFVSGDAVYVSMSGQILGVVTAPTYATTYVPHSGGRAHGPSGGGGGDDGGHDDSGGSGE